jgi:WD40 repeat protein
VKKLVALQVLVILLTLTQFSAPELAAKPTNSFQNSHEVNSDKTIPSKQFYHVGLGSVNEDSLSDKEYLIASGEIGTYVYDSETLELLLSSKAEIPVTFHGSSNDGIHSLAWSPNDLTLALGAGNGKLYLWNTQQHQPIRVIKFDEGNKLVTGLAWSPDSTEIAAQIMFDVIKVWNAETGETLQSFDNKIYTTAYLEFSPDGKLIASVGDLNTSVVVWSIETGKPLYTFKDFAEGIHQWSVAFSPNGSTLATGSDKGEITIRNLSTGEISKVLTGLTRDVSDINWSPDGNTVVASSTDLVGLSNIDGATPVMNENSTIIWDTKSGYIQYSFNDQSQVALSHDGTIIASTNASNQILLQDTGSGKIINTLRSHLKIRQ